MRMRGKKSLGNKYRRGGRESRELEDVGER